MLTAARDREDTLKQGNGRAKGNHKRGRYDNQDEIETEADLIAALSEKGRYLAYTGRYIIRTSKDGTSHASVEGKADFIVNDELGDAWTDAHDDTSPEAGPWCSHETPAGLLAVA